MREPNIALQEYNQDDSLVAIDGEKALDVFKIPERNWELIIDSYNQSSKTRFFLSALQCKTLVEYVKKDFEPQYIFQNYGYSYQKYTSLVTKAADLEDKLVELSTKSNLTEDDYEEFQTIMRHPLRILMSDIDRARGVANLSNWERFNEMAYHDGGIMVQKMRGKFREFFEGKESNGGGNQVVINLGPGIIDGL